MDLSDKNTYYKVYNIIDINNKKLVGKLLLLHLAGDGDS